MEDEMQNIHTRAGTATYYSMTSMMSWRDSKAAYSWMRLAWLSWFITWISFLTTSWNTDGNTKHFTHLAYEIFFVTSSYISLLSDILDVLLKKLIFVF